MRFRVKLVVLAIIAAAAAYLGNAVAAEKALKIGECMKCQNSARSDLKRMAKGGKWDWEQASKSTKSWLEAAGDMTKNKPPVGDEKSWKELTTKYVTNVKAVDGAVGKKDASAVTKAMGVFDASCRACHSKHKPPKE